MLQVGKNLADKDRYGVVGDDGNIGERKEKQKRTLSATGYVCRL